MDVFFLLKNLKPSQPVGCSGIKFSQALNSSHVLGYSKPSSTTLSPTFTLSYLLNYSKKASNDGFITLLTIILCVALFNNSYAQSPITERGSSSQKEFSISDEFLSGLNDEEVQMSEQIDTLYIYYNNNLPNEVVKRIEARKGKHHFAIPYDKVKKVLSQLVEQLSAYGDPFSSIKLVNINTRGRSSLIAELEVKQHKVRTLDKIIIKGYEKFPKRYIQHYLRLKKGMLLKLAQIKKQSRKISRLTFATQTREPEILFSKDSSILYLYLRKKNSNFFDGFLGFGSESNEKITLNGNMRFKMNNNLHFGESFSFLYRSDQTEQRQMNLNLNLPYLLKLPVGLELSLEIFKKDSTFHSTKQAMEIYYLTNRSTFKTIFQQTQSDRGSKISTEKTVGDFRSTFYGISYIHEVSSGKILFPIKSRFTFEMLYGFRKNNRLREDQATLSCEVSQIFKLNHRSSFYLGLEGKSLLSDSYLENEYFRFGGNRSIRGFSENSLSASTYGVLNTEYRYELNSSLYLHSILDAAYLEDPLISEHKNLISTGFGIGVLTKSGVFKLNYVIGKIDDQAFELNQARVHLSLSSYF